MGSNVLFILLSAVFLPLLIRGQICDGGELDCAGVCNGTSVKDSASTCCLPSEIDCGGICFRGHVVDICGVCNGDESTCCSCPRGKDYYATHHCRAVVPLRAVSWPAPFDGSCTVPSVAGCSGDGYGADLLSLEPSANNAYIELVQEYTVARINKQATGLVTCTETAGPSGEDLDVVMNNAKAYVAENCNTRVVNSSNQYYDQVRKTTYLLRGYNEGYLFAGDLCNRDGIDDISNGGDRLGVDEMCVGGCTSNAQFYYDINCAFGGSVGQGSCPGNWPESVGETLTLCGEETYASVLLGSGPGVDDVYLDLASAYVTALLNRVHRKACATSEVIRAMSTASILLADKCGCSPGQQGCTHDALESASAEAQAVAVGPLAVLNKYNEGTLGPGACGLEPTSVKNGEEDSQLNTCCAGGCSYSVGHWALYSCNLPVPAGDDVEAPAARVPWPGGENADCFVKPNAEDAQICGEGMYSVLSRSVTVRGDAWTNLAGQYIAATLNVANGACTSFYGALTTSKLTSFEALLSDTLKELESNCATANDTAVSSTLGVSMYTKELLLEAFNSGDLGPGSCSPNDDGTCNENPDSFPLSSSRCYVSESQEEVSSCVYSGEFWKRTHYFGEHPRDVRWPLFHQTYLCDPVKHACTTTDTQQTDAIGDAIARVLRIDPMALGHFTNGQLGQKLQLLQETGSWCPSFMGHNNFSVHGRADATAMLNMLRFSDNSVRGPLSAAQRKWANAASALTVALLNVRRIAQTPKDVDALFETLVSASGTLVTPVLSALFVDNCLLRACKESPETAIPGFPDHLSSCAAGYNTFVSALNRFSNGRTEGHPHCGFGEPPQQCGLTSTGRACGCTHTLDYYRQFHARMNLAGLESETRLEWPKIDADLYPGDPDTIPSNTEDFRGLVCTGDGDWLSVVKSLWDSTDAYLVLTKTLITAWLNVFSSECVPADILEVLQHATQYVEKRLTSGLCTSEGHLPVDARTHDGRIMLSYAQAISPYAESSTHRCDTRCSIDCGEHGTCSPLDGECYCEYGWKGDLCDSRDCTGHGIDDGTGVCHCFGGYSGANCDACGAPVAVSGRSYVCRPCPPAVCGFANGVQGIPLEDGTSEDAVVFLLSMVPSDKLEAYILGNIRFPNSEGLPLPVRPGHSGLACNCKYEEESSLRTSTYGALVSVRGTVSRRGGYSKYQRTTGNAYYDSRYHSSPGAHQITARQQSVQARLAQRGVGNVRHETNITNQYYENVIDAIDALYYQLIMSEETCEIYADYTECEQQPLVTNRDLRERADDDHDRITGYGIAIVTIVSVVLLGLILMSVVMMLMWLGVSLRSNPFESRRNRAPKKRRMASKSDIVGARIQRRRNSQRDHNETGIRSSRQEAGSMRIRRGS